MILVNSNIILNLHWISQLLAGEMLHVAQAFIDKNYHPTVICRGEIFGSQVSFLRHFSLSCFLSVLKLWFSTFSAYTKALDDALAVLDKIAMPVDVDDRKS
jgi:T-complex protein 1 subunit gamma